MKILTANQRECITDRHLQNYIILPINVPAFSSQPSGIFSQQLYRR